MTGWKKNGGGKTEKQTHTQKQTHSIIIKIRRGQKTRQMERRSKTQEVRTSKKHKRETETHER